MINTNLKPNNLLIKVFLEKMIILFNSFVEFLASNSHFLIALSKITVILFSIYRTSLEKRKQTSKHKKSDMLKIIEAVLLKYKTRVLKKKRKKLKLLNYPIPLRNILRFTFFKDNIHLHLLRKIVYRILDRSIKDHNVRKLVKREILKSPEGTFSEFVKLYKELRNEKD